MPMIKLNIKFPKLSTENGTMQLNTIHTHTYKYANLDVKSIFVCNAKQIKLTATINTNKIVNNIVCVV